MKVFSLSRFTGWSSPKARRQREKTAQRIECCEARILPAITAIVSKGELRLTGDANPNEVEIQKSGDSIQVVGKNGTMIRVGGSESGTASFSGVTSVRATLKGSNDTVQIADGLSLKNVTLTLGAGTNNVLIGASNISGKLTVTGGAGIDNIRLMQSVIGNATLTTGSGDDRVTFGAVSANGIVTVNTGNGADLVETILVTPSGGGGGIVGGGISGVGGLGGVTLLNDLSQFLTTETERNLGDFVDLEELQDFVDENAGFNFGLIQEIAETVGLDSILNNNGTLNLLNLVGLGNIFDLGGLDTGALQELTGIVNLRELTSDQLELLDRLMSFASEFGLDNLLDVDDLVVPSQPQGLGSRFTATLNVNTGSGDDVVSLGNARFGVISVLTGNDRDQVLLNTIAVDNIIKINAGSGDDQIKLNGVQQNGSGSNLIDGSTGIDTVSVSASLFSSGVTLSGGTSNGNQILIDDVLFKSFATINALGIGDLVKIEQNRLFSGSTVFTQAARSTIGGATEITVSQNQPTTATRFLSTAKVTGKTPRGRLKVAIDRTEFSSPVSLTNVDYSVV